MSKKTRRTVIQRPFNATYGTPLICNPMESAMQIKDSVARGNSDDCALAPLPQTLEQSNAFDVRY
jgi:hypothetical protein